MGRVRNDKNKKASISRNLFQAELLNLVKEISLLANSSDDFHRIAFVVFDRIIGISNIQVASLWVNDSTSNNRLIFDGTCLTGLNYSKQSISAHFGKISIQKSDLFSSNPEDEKKYVFLDSKTLVIGELTNTSHLAQINSSLFVSILTETTLAGGLLFMSEEIITESRQFLNALETIASIIARIIERRQKEEELIRKNLLYSAAQELTQTGSWELDLSYMHFYWSEELYKIFRKKKEDFDLSYRSFQSFIHPVDAEKFDAVIKNSIRRKKKFEIELRMISLDESERFLHLIGSPVTDNDGKVSLIRGVGRDITAEKKSKEKAIIKEQQLDQAQKIAGLGYWEWDVLTDKVLWSDELYKIFGIDKKQQEITLETYLSKLHKDDRESSRRQIMEAIEKKSSFSGSERIVLPGGSIRYIKSGGKVFIDEEGRVTKMMGICYDIDELKRKELEIQSINLSLEEKVVRRTKDLERANQDLESFAGIVSHDLKAPVRAVRGFIELLNEKCESSGDEETKQLLQMIASTASGMAMLIDDILEFSRAGTKNLEMEKVNFLEMINSIINQLQKASTYHAVFIIRKLPNGRADASLIRQVFINLISNAMKFSSKKTSSEIVIDCKEDNAKMIFSVSDNGVGFNPEFSDKLFGPFYRLHSTAEFEGSGLGLALCRRIVERHGGKIWAISEGENKGATFYFSLPKC